MTILAFERPVDLCIEPQHRVVLREFVASSFQADSKGMARNLQPDPWKRQRPAFQHPEGNRNAWRIFICSRRVRSESISCAWQEGLRFFFWLY